MKALTKEKCTRFVCQQLVEDSFNNVKHMVDKRQNSVCTPQATMAAIVDSKVISQTHKYVGVDRTTEVAERDSAFHPCAFKPALQRRHLSQEMKDLGLSNVASCSDPTWYSPGPAGYCQSFCDIEAVRQAARGDRLEHLGSRWLAKLIGKWIMFRRCGTTDWFMGLGSIGGSLAVGWPMKQMGDKRWAPAITKSRSLSLIVKAEEWEAVALEFQSPMHQALVEELTKDGAAVDKSKNVALKAVILLCLPSLAGMAQGTPHL